MLCRMVFLSRKKDNGKVPVYLNVYDLTPMNGYTYWLGLGVYHSGVQGNGLLPIVNMFLLLFDNSFFYEIGCVLDFCFNLLIPIILFLVARIQRLNLLREFNHLGYMDIDSNALFGLWVAKFLFE